MKSISVFAILVVAVCVLNGCASETTTASSSAGDPVPGQAKSSEDRIAPSMGSAGPNASVKW